MIPIRWCRSAAHFTELRIILRRIGFTLASESRLDLRLFLTWRVKVCLSKSNTSRRTLHARRAVAPRRASVLTGSSNSPPACLPRARACRYVSQNTTCDRLHLLLVQDGTSFQSWNRLDPPFRRTRAATSLALTVLCRPGSFHD